MEWLKSIFGGGSVLSAAEGIVNVIDKFVETPEEKRAYEMLKTKLMLQPSLAQIELNRVEAMHRSMFVAGWRPFVGWICGVALAWHYIGNPLMSWYVSVWQPDAKVPEFLGLGDLMPLLMALLGFGAVRSMEKFGGRSR